MVKHIFSVEVFKDENKKNASFYFFTTYTISRGNKILQKIAEQNEGKNLEIRYRKSTTRKHEKIETVKN